MGCRKLTYYENQEEGAIKPLLLKNTDTLSKKVRSLKKCDSYSPFGLTFNSFKRDGGLENKFRFQEQEHIDDLGLNWDSFKWRNHQPDIGRFFNVDPLADSYVYNSPYAFAENRVIDGRELEGLEWESIKEIGKGVKEWGKTVTSKESYVEVGKGFKQMGSDIKKSVSGAIDFVVDGLKQRDKAMDGGSGSINTSKNFIGDDSSVRKAGSGMIDGETEVDQFIGMPTPTNSPTNAIEAGAGLYAAFSNASTIVDAVEEVAPKTKPRTDYMTVIMKKGINGGTNVPVSVELLIKGNDTIRRTPFVAPPEKKK